MLERYNFVSTSHKPVPSSPLGNFLSPARLPWVLGRLPPPFQASYPPCIIVRTDYPPPPHSTFPLPTHPLRREFGVFQYLADLEIVLSSNYWFYSKSSDPSLHTHPQLPSPPLWLNPPELQYFTAYSIPPFLFRFIRAF